MYCSLAVYLLLFSAFGYLHSPITAYGASYRRSVCIEYESAIRTSCGSSLLRHGLNFSTAWCYMRSFRGKKYWKHVSTQKVITLNTCCDAACLVFQLPHITTGSFQSHQHLKERNKPLSVTWKSFAFHKLVWWHFQVWWLSGLQFVSFWDNVKDSMMTHKISYNERMNRMLNELVRKLNKSRSTDRTSEVQLSGRPRCSRTRENAKVVFYRLTIKGDWPV